jgi:hypothetical protein
MWFISFALGAATCISIVVYGWASYLEYTKAVAAEAHARELMAFVPMPPTRPFPRSLPKAQMSQVEPEIEVVRVPKATKAVWKARRKPRHVTRRAGSRRR